ncbi:hypothetical protein CRE_12957 [Caenorhabditis remanei]|uniref:G-protein coupled receptors family 1 profile domain-containing protein n=1 Tax=Caenorhabditis remanei TaxID=31234 RepID=E3N0Z1_CAERE|nr:hypothetical protein CRE_12957 [Caenorhabditis remanei]
MRKIHEKNPTTSPRPLRTTTEYEYEPLVFYPWTGDCTDCIDTDSIFTFDVETEVGFLKYSKLLNEVATYVGLFLNLLHFFVLTRKELRNNAVFFIMIGICVSDILVFASSISEAFVYDYAYIAEKIGTCASFKQWLYMGIEWYSGGVQKFGRMCSIVLALSMTFIRTLSVMFSMSAVANRLTKLSTAIFIVFIFYLILGIWYAEFYLRAKPHKDVLSFCYFIGLEDEKVAQHELTEGFSILVLTVIYTFLTVILLAALKIAKKRRKRLGTEKQDNTSNLIIGMTVSFLIATVGYSILFIFSKWPYPNDNIPFFRVQLTMMLAHVPKTLLTMNSVTHCFVCLFMSSHYREVAMKLFWRWAKTKVNEPTRTESIVVATGNTSKNSTKSY